VLSVVALVASCVLVCIVCCLCRRRQDRCEEQNTIENYLVKIMGGERAKCVIEKHPPKQSQEIDLHWDLEHGCSPSDVHETHMRYLEQNGKTHMV